MAWSLRTFRGMIWMICVAGMTQGLLIPLLTMFLEERGVQADFNGLSASALYLGILLAAPLGPAMVRRIGVKKSILAGLYIVTVAVCFFPFFQSFWVWTGLRFLVGIGDSLLHYATQLWITIHAPVKERGRRISQYGFAYGLGFGIGPLGLNLVHFGETVPFLFVLCILFFSIYLTGRLTIAEFLGNEWKETEANGQGSLRTVYRLGFIAFCSPFIYGFLETALTGNFPVIGMREGMGQSFISLLISAFVWGSLLFQVPLGVLGDRIGRKNLLILVCSAGAAGMFVIPYFLSNGIYLFVSFVLIGGLVGSLYSMGLACATDLLPARFLPAANAIASVHFSVGSILGPSLGGFSIEKAGGEMLFITIGCMLAGYVLMILLEKMSNRMNSFKSKEKQAV